MTEEKKPNNCRTGGVSGFSWCIEESGMAPPWQSNSKPLPKTEASGWPQPIRARLLHSLAGSVATDATGAPPCRPSHQNFNHVKALSLSRVFHSFSFLLSWFTYFSLFPVSCYGVVFPSLSSVLSFCLTCGWGSFSFPHPPHPLGAFLPSGPWQVTGNQPEQEAPMAVAVGTELPFLSFLACIPSRPAYQQDTTFHHIQ